VALTVKETAAPAGTDWSCGSCVITGRFRRRRRCESGLSLRVGRQVDEDRGLAGRRFLAVQHPAVEGPLAVTGRRLQRSPGEGREDAAEIALAVLPSVDVRLADGDHGREIIADLHLQLPFVAAGVVEVELDFDVQVVTAKSMPLSVSTSLVMRMSAQAAGLEKRSSLESAEGC